MWYTNYSVLHPLIWCINEYWILECDVLYSYGVNEYINHATYRKCGWFSIAIFTSIGEIYGSNIITIASRWCHIFPDLRRCLFIWAVNNGCSNVYGNKLDNKGVKRDVVEWMIWCDRFTNLLTLLIFDGPFHVWC